MDMERDLLEGLDFLVGSVCDDLALVFDGLDVLREALDKITWQAQCRLLASHGVGRVKVVAVGVGHQLHLILTDVCWIGLLEMSESVADVDSCLALGSDTRAQLDSIVSDLILLAFRLHSDFLVVLKSLHTGKVA